jgi:hypothetical protein
MGWRLEADYRTNVSLRSSGCDDKVAVLTTTSRRRFHNDDARYNLLVPTLALKLLWRTSTGGSPVLEHDTAKLGDMHFSLARHNRHNDQRGSLASATVLFRSLYHLVSCMLSTE